MYINYTIIIKSNHWPRRLYKIKKIIKTFYKYKRMLGYIKDTHYYCNIVLTNDLLVKKLNQQYKKQNKSTNVLTFISTIKKNSVIEKHCDIMFSAETIANEAKENKRNFYDHFTHLIVHCILHINGYSHGSKKKFFIMKNKEISILNRLGVANPYL